MAHRKKLGNPKARLPSARSKKFGRRNDDALNPRAQDPFERPMDFMEDFGEKFDARDLGKKIKFDSFESGNFSGKARSKGFGGIPLIESFANVDKKTKAEVENLKKRTKKHSQEIKDKADGSFFGGF